MGDAAGAGCARIWKDGFLMPHGLPLASKNLRLKELRNNLLWRTTAGVLRGR